MNKEELTDFLGILHFHGYIDHDASKLGDLADMADFTTPFTPPHSAPHEAGELFKKFGYHNAISLVEYAKLNLKAANVSTEWHEQVLNELKQL